MNENPACEHNFVEILSKNVLLDPRYKLVDLEVENCSIGDKGATHLGEALNQKNCKLRFLNISNNNIKLSGAK